MSDLLKDLINKLAEKNPSVRGFLFEEVFLNHIKRHSYLRVIINNPATKTHSVVNFPNVTLQNMRVASSV